MYVNQLRKFLYKITFIIGSEKHNICESKKYVWSILNTSTWNNDWSNQNFLSKGSNIICSWREGSIILRCQISLTDLMLLRRDTISEILLSVVSDA